MTDLVRPDVRRHDSLVATFDDFGEGHVDGSGTWALDGPLGRTRDDVERFVAVLRAADDDDPARPAWLGADRPWVRCTFLWVTDGEPGSGGGDVVGFLALRHDVPGWLFEQGGHIGYSIRPARRREGHASRALALALERAAGLGIDPALVCCHHENTASRRTIEGAGGVLEDRRGDQLRFWVPTS